MSHSASLNSGRSGVFCSGGGLSVNAVSATDRWDSICLWDALRPPWASHLRARLSLVSIECACNSFAFMYLFRFLRGKDFCSDIGDMSEEVLDWAPWYTKSMKKKRITRLYIVYLVKNICAYTVSDLHSLLHRNNNFVQYEGVFISKFWWLISIIDITKYERKACGSCWCLELHRWGLYN